MRVMGTVEPLPIIGTWELATILHTSQKTARRFCKFHQIKAHRLTDRVSGRTRTGAGPVFYSRQAVMRVIKHLVD